MHYGFRVIVLVFKYLASMCYGVSDLWFEYVFMIMLCMLS